MAFTVSHVFDNRRTAGSDRYAALFDALRVLADDGTITVDFHLAIDDQSDQDQVRVRVWTATHRRASADWAAELVPDHPCPHLYSRVFTSREFAGGLAGVAIVALLLGRAAEGDGEGPGRTNIISE